MMASVFMINGKNGYVAADPDSNGQYYSIIDFQGGEVAIGDSLIWDDNVGLGSGKLLIKRTGKTVDVIF